MAGEKDVQGESETAGEGDAQAESQPAGPAEMVAEDTAVGDSEVAGEKDVQGDSETAGEGDTQAESEPAGPDKVQAESETAGNDNAGQGESGPWLSLDAADGVAVQKPPQTECCEAGSAGASKSTNGAGIQLTDGAIAKAISCALTEIGITTVMAIQSPPSL
jgi:hypothetical protein